MSAEDRRIARERRNSLRRTRFVRVDEAIPLGDRPCGCIPFGTHALALGIFVYTYTHSGLFPCPDDVEECRACGATWTFFERRGRLPRGCFGGRG